MGGVQLLVSNYTLLEEGSVNFTATLELTTNSLTVLNMVSWCSTFIIDYLLMILGHCPF